MNRRIATILILIAVTIPVIAQSPPPFVSRLTARADEETIRLTWQDATESVDRYLIYRHTAAIADANFAEATFIGSVEEGQMVFVDYPPDTSDYFYTVVVADEDGNPAAVFIPFRNKTTTGAAVDAEALERTLPVSIESIRASINRDEVFLEFSTSSDKREISVYRGTQPIGVPADLLSAILIDNIPSSQQEYRDSPVAGLDYFYALFDTELLRVGKQRMLPDQNVLREPIAIPLSEQTTLDAVRARPLPFLILSSKIDTGEALSGGVGQSLETPPEELSAAVIAAIDRLSGNETQLITIIETSVVLPVDRFVDGDDGKSDLSSLLSEHFETEAWSEAREALEKFLLTRRSPELSARARFYIGQTYYFENLLREAFIQFLYAAEDYYPDANPWMDTILQQLELLDD